MCVFDAQTGRCRKLSKQSSQVGMQENGNAMDRLWERLFLCFHGKKRACKGEATLNVSWKGR